MGITLEDMCIRRSSYSSGFARSHVRLRCASVSDQGLRPASPQAGSKFEVKIIAD